MNNHFLSKTDLSQRVDDPAYIRAHVAYRLIHAPSHSELLKQIPHLPFFDLAKVFFLDLGQEEDTQLTLPITNSHLECWEMSLPQMDALSQENTPRLFPPCLSSISETLDHYCQSLSSRALPSPLLSLQPNAPFPKKGDLFYILTNPTGLNGAACMAYPHILKNFADYLEQDLLILPSSIHEVLLVPASGNEDWQKLCRIISQINHSQVAKEERLSNQVYSYSRAEDQLFLKSDFPEPL